MQIGYIKEASEKENVFKIHVDEIDSYAVTLVSVEGKANLYVNPGYLPKDNSLFYYSALQEMTKRVIIEKRELNGMGLSNPVNQYNAGFIRQGELRACLQVHSEGKENYK